MKIKKFVSFITASVLTACCFPAGLTYAEPESQSVISDITQEEISVESTNSFGALISDEISLKQNEEMENNGCNIFSVQVDGAEAHVEFETITDCTIIVGIYDESGETMLASGSLEVASDQTEADVEIQTDEMPEYFYIRSFLVDTDTLAPICTEYDSPNYTQEMQEFLAKDIYDFDENYVLNLDDDSQNNFAVFNESAILSQSNETINTVVSADDENGVYVLENIDETVSSLKSGDIFSCEYGENELLIAKVSGIEINGTTATITSEDTSLDEVFDYVKIDSASGLADADIDYDAMDEGIEYIGSENENPLSDFSGTNKNASIDENLTADTIKLNIASKKIGKLTLSGSLSLGSSASIKTYISLRYQYFEFKLNNKLGFNISLSGSATSPALIKLPAFDFSPVPGIYIGVQPALKIKFSGSISFGGSISSCVGFCYDSDTGFKNLTSKPTVGDMTLTAEAKLFIGLVIEPRVYIASDKVAKASLEGTAGVEISAKLEKKVGDYDSTHECNLCIDGSTCAKISLSCKLAFLSLDNLTWEHTFKEWSIKLNDFYYSIDKKQFGWGSCPYDKHTVYVKVLTGGNNYPNAGAIVRCGDQKATTDKDGIAELLLSDGFYKMTVSCYNCKLLKKSFFVYGQNKNITVHPTIIDPSQTDGTTTVTAPIVNPTTTTTIALDQPDENGNITINGVVYTCYDDYAEVSGYTVDLPANVTLLKEVCGVPVTEIGYRAFYNSKELTHLTIPDTISTISSNAFHFCYKLTDLTLPFSIQKIDEYAFGYCQSLTNIYVDDSNTWFCDIDGVLFNKSKDTLVQYPTGKSNSLYKVPNTVNKINGKAFITCESLVSVIVPESVTSICELSFSYSSIKTLYLPNSLMFIGERALSDSSITDIYYSGTQDEWKAINKTWGNDIDATIHYNSTGPASYSLTPENIKVLSNEEASASFSGLAPGGVYNFYAVADKEAENVIAPENLLYVIQFTADENGNAELSYIPPSGCGTFIVGALRNIENAEISVSDMDYTGTELVPNIAVIFGDRQLADGEDYEIEGDVSALKPGAYKVLLKGIGDFFGYTEVRYEILCRHRFESGVCVECGASDPNYVPITTTTTTTTTVTTTTTITTVTKPDANIRYGDVNDSGTVDALDASLVLTAYAMKAIGQTPNLNSEHLKAADINNDGNVDALDASLILVYYAYRATGGDKNIMDYLKKI